MKIQEYEEYVDIRTLVDVAEHLVYLRTHICPECQTEGHFMLKQDEDIYYCSECHYRGNIEVDHENKYSLIDELKMGKYSDDYIGEMFDGYDI